MVNVLEMKSIIQVIFRRCNDCGMHVCLSRRKDGSKQ